LFWDVTPLEVQDSEVVIPFATFTHSENALNAAKIFATLMVELCPPGTKLNIPDVFKNQIKTAAELETDENIGELGNVGTVSDDADIKFLDHNGRVIS
jgi:hypothetical protein